MILKWSFGISFVFFALAMFIPDLLMRIYTPEAALIEIGASYLRIVSVSYLFSGVTQCYYLKMKMEGKASKSVIISTVTLITDVVLVIRKIRPASRCFYLPHLLPIPQQQNCQQEDPRECFRIGNYHVAEHRFKRIGAENPYTEGQDARYSGE